MRRLLPLFVITVLMLLTPALSQARAKYCWMTKNNKLICITEKGDCDNDRRSELRTKWNATWASCVNVSVAAHPKEIGRGEIISAFTCGMDDSSKTHVEVVNRGTDTVEDLRVYFVGRDSVGGMTHNAELFNLTAAELSYDVTLMADITDHTDWMKVMTEPLSSSYVPEPDSIYLRVVQRDLVTKAFVSDVILRTAIPLPAMVGVRPLEEARAVNVTVFPNPTSGGLRVDFMLPTASPTSIDIYNVAGQRVKRLHDGMTAAGTHTFTWSGVTSNGTTVSPGVYFVRLSTRDFRGADRMVVVR